MVWALMIAVAAALMVAAKGDLVLGDPDTQWHIASGRLMWETGVLPRVDTMSHTHAGQPWIAKEWLSQLLLFWAYALGGWPATFLLTAVAVGAAAGIIARRVLASCPPILTMVIMWATTMGLLLVACARPHALALPVMALFTVKLLDAAEGDGTPPWMALPLFALWANLHAAFMLGFVVAGMLGLDALLRAAPERRARLALLWALFGLGCLVAVCVHPYGAASLLIAIDLARGNESVPLINEWNQFDLFSSMGPSLLIPAAMIACLGVAGRAALARLALGLFLLYLAFKHQRFIMTLAVVAPLISAAAFMQALQALAARLKLFQDDDPLRSARWRVPAALAGLAGLVAMPFAALGPTPPANIAPEAALASVPAEIRAAPLYNSYNFGGFLVMRGVPTFIDGRTDQLFTQDFMARMFRYLKGQDREGFMAFVSGYGARWALVQEGHRDTDFFAASPEWRETYRDKEARVYVRAGG
jgi:hypothetical protein